MLHADQQQLDIGTLASQPVMDALQITDNIGLRLGHSSAADLQPALLADSGSVLSLQPSTSASSDSMQPSQDVGTEKVVQLISVEHASHVLQAPARQYILEHKVGGFRGQGLK